MREINWHEYRPLSVVAQLRYSILQKVQKGEDPLPEIQGREEAKKDVLRALLSGTHPYLVAEEGTGKTRLAKSLTKLLLPVPVVKGCPYYDDPYWPRERLCPRCRAVANPLAEYGIVIVPGWLRFSRIQGNEYTNEAKLLGLKDIHAIAQGRSPADPQVFMGTGIFRANRGILFVDELPAIRTKVQVLLHPVLEEQKAILEEYNWEHPLDLLVVATGNPQGFSHVNEVPRPLLDRLELIYLDLPEEDTERQIMLQEKFKLGREETPQTPPAEELVLPAESELERRVAAPWWIMDLINKAVRHSRHCRWLERKASVRGTIRGLDHTYASAELENRRVATLKDAAAGLKLALRSRIGLRADLVDFENPKENFRKTDEVSEDLLWNALEDFPLALEVDEPNFRTELATLAAGGVDLILRLDEFPEVSKVVTAMEQIALQKVSPELNELEQKLYLEPASVPPEILAAYRYAAVETIANLAWHRGLLATPLKGHFYFPKMVSWAAKGPWS